MVEKGDARTVGARLAAARASAFVGREAPVELLRAALEEDEPSFSVMHVHGPGGIGKTSLVRRLVHEAQKHDVPVTVADGHAIAVTEIGLRRALGAEDLSTLVASLARPRALLVIDTYEMLASLDDYVREVLAPALPVGTILLIAGRDPPTTAWRQDAGWASLLRPIALRNFAPHETASLLEARGLPTHLHAPMHQLTYGHPLTVALVADACRQSEWKSLPALTADVLGPLLDRLLRALPSDRHREALEVAAIARVVDGSVMKDLAGDEDGALFAWLRTLSFVEATPEGLYLHDLVREALIADARLRAPEALHARRVSLVQRASRRLATESGAHRARLVLDLLHNFRADTTMRRFFGWDAHLDGRSRPMRADELDALLAVATQHEGEAAAAVARRMYAARPDAFVTLESARGETLGFLVYVRFDAAQLESLVAIDGADTVTQAAARLIQSHGLRPGEEGALLRFWLWTRDYQGLGAEAHTAHSMHLALHWASTPALGPVIAVVQNAELWEPFLTNISFHPTNERVALGGHTFRLFLRDFRRDPMVSTSGENKRAVQRVLSHEDFVEAVREAFRAARHPADLASSPLLGSRMMLDWSEGETPTAEMLVELLKAAVTSLDERDEQPRRAVELNCFEGLTQQVAADRIGLTFVTYRRKLTRGVEKATAWLWERETRGAA